MDQLLMLKKNRGTIRSFDNELHMSLDEFTMIRDFIHEKSGIFFADDKTYLVRDRLSRRISELDMKSVRDYFYHVKYDTSMQEFHHLMTLVTTNETSFFRNEPQLLSFSDEVLPMLVEQKEAAGKPKQIRLWSAGCSTGEEPYTLAMILLEKLGAHSGWNLEIYANDISEAVLKKARLGEYSGNTLQNTKPQILEKYFDRDGDLYRVKPEVRALVRFSHINLNDPRRTLAGSPMDAVFCRNVMTYFSDDAKRSLVRGFYNVMQPGGYLYIGHSETLHGVSKAFRLVYFKNALVYQKEKTAQRSTPTRVDSAIESRFETGPISARSGAADSATKALDLLARVKTARSEEVSQSQCVHTGD